MPWTLDQPHYCSKCKKMVDVTITTIYEKDRIYHVFCDVCGHKILKHKEIMMGCK